MTLYAGQGGGRGYVMTEVDDTQEDKCVLAFKEREGKPGGGKGVLVNRNSAFTIGSADKVPTVCYANPIVYCLQGGGETSSGSQGGKGWNEGGGLLHLEYD